MRTTKELLTFGTTLSELRSVLLSLKYSVVILVLAGASSFDHRNTFATLLAGTTITISLLWPILLKLLSRTTLLSRKLMLLHATTVIWMAILPALVPLALAT